MEKTENNIITNKDKALALYKYLKEFCALNNKKITNIQTYDWKLFFEDIPNDKENIKFSYKDRIKVRRLGFNPTENFTVSWQSKKHVIARKSCEKLMNKSRLTKLKGNEFFCCI